MQDTTDNKETNDSPARTTAEQDQAVAKCSDWFDKDKDAKLFLVDEMADLDKLYNNKHWDLAGPTGYAIRTPEQQEGRPNSVENVTFSLLEGQIAEFAREVELVDFPVEASDQPVADLMGDVKKFVLHKNDFNLEQLDWNRNLFKYGTAIWHPYWDPDWKGGVGPNRWVGEIRIKSLHPRNFFPDSRCKKDVQEGKRVHKALFVPIETVRDAFPDYGHLAQADSADTTLLDGDTDNTSDDAEQVLLVETWYIGRPLLLEQGETDEGPGLHVVWWAGESSSVYLGHANYVYFAPGETPIFPFIVRQRYTRENSIWGYGEGHFLKQPQIMLNKTAEIIMDSHLHHAIGQTMFEPGAVSVKQEKKIVEDGNIPGMWLQVQDLNGVKREFGQGAPGSLQNEMARLQRAMETIIGRFDISQGQTPGSVTAFRALELLAQRAQVRLRTAETVINSGYEKLGAYINLLIYQHYTEARAYRIVGMDDAGRPVVKKRAVFQLDQVQKVHMTGTGEVVPKEGFTAGPDMVEGEDFEVYCPELDVICRTSTSLPSDRMFHMEMAKELFSSETIDAETFFYVVEKGKFPPFEELVQKLQQQAEAAAQPPAQALPAPAPAPNQAPAPAPGISPEEEAFMQSLPPEMLDQLMALPPEQLDAAVNQLMQQASGGMAGG